MIVCPTQAIRVGDLDDPDVRDLPILFASGEGKVRTPEQKTLPKVVYKGARPLDARSRWPRPSPPMGLIWADTTPGALHADPRGSHRSALA